jgi:hypothetical protein
MATKVLKGMGTGAVVIIVDKIFQRIIHCNQSFRA